MVLGCRTHRNGAKRGGGNVGGGSSRSRDFGEYWLGFLGAGNGCGEGVYMGKEGSDLIAIFQRILIRNKLGFSGVRVLHGLGMKMTSGPRLEVREGGRWAARLVCWAVPSCARGR